MQKEFLGKNGLVRFLAKLFETFSEVGHTHSKADIKDFPTIPTKTSQLTNDSGFKTTDNNTTYTLTKSGSVITLTGTDGSSTSVDDSDTKITVDSSMSSTSTNPVQNKVVNSAIADAKAYADSAASKIKSDLLNGAGAAYDTLKELGELIVDNTDAIDALEIIASGKANSEHGHAIVDVSGLQTALDGKAASSHGTHVSYTTTAPVMDGTASAGSANTVARSDHKHPVDTSRASQADLSALQDTVSGKANASHTHAITDITNLQSSLDGKAAKSHGTHVPTPETANSAKFLRNDNTWQTVTPANIGAAASSHGTHVTFSSTAPVMDGTASVGSASTVSRSDHKHPTDTSRAAKSDFDSHTGNTTVHITSTERSNWNAAKSHADSAHAPSAAEVNQNAFSYVAVGSTTISADSKTDTLTLAGSNVTITPDVTNDKVTIGITKDNVVGALGYTPPTKDTVYTHPSTSGNKHIPAGGSSGQILRWYADGTAAWGSDNNTTYGAAGSALGLVKTGGDVSITDGVITVNDDSHNHVISNIDGLQSALDGKAASSHGTHVTFSSTAPVVAGTASVGSSSAVSRSDHVHPAQTSVSGNAGSATKWATSRNINGMSVNGEANRFNYGTCSTAAGTAAKTVSCTGFSLATGSEITVKFTVTNTASNPTLNVNSTGAKSIYYRGSAISKDYLAANRTYTFRYNGTQYDLVGDIDTKTTVDSAMSATSTNPVQNKVVKAAIDKLGSVDIDLTGATPGTANLIDADTLGGFLPEHYATTEMVNGITAENIGAMSIELLWQNGDPNSSIAACHIPFDKKSYKMFMVVDNDGITAIIADNGRSFVNLYMSTAISFRQIRINETGMNITDAYLYWYGGSSSSVDNSYNIIYKVYGIGGASA